VLEDDHKSFIAAMPKENLDELHFSLGLAIRNAFDNWYPMSTLLSSNNPMYTDEVSDHIIHQLWQRLNQQGIYTTNNILSISNRLN
jgi:hypothetical protein